MYSNGNSFGNSASCVEVIVGVTTGIIGVGALPILPRAERK